MLIVNEMADGGNFLWGAVCIYIFITLSYVLVLSLMALSHLSVLVRGVWHNGTQCSVEYH